MSSLMSSLARLRPVWILVVCVVPWFAPAIVRARPDGPPSSSAASAPAVQGRESGRKSKRKKRRKNGNVGNVGNVGRASKLGGHAPGPSSALAHHRDRRHLIPSSPAQPAAKVALVTSPGPAQTPAALRAMEDVRHMQIERAENAARRDDLTNRWETVNFLISGVDEQRYPQAGFWKILACYRRGRISEGDSTRQRCRLSPADVHALDGERAVAMLLSEKNGAPSLEASALTGTAGGRPEGVVNNAAYTGPGPTPGEPHAVAP